MLTLSIAAITGYLFGSLPTGYLAGRLAGVDIRKLGSGNIGATNLLRVLGKRFGYPVFVIDFAKGLAAVLLALLLARRSGANESFVQFCGATAGVFAVVGHCCPVWLRFKGGKGVATSIGVLFGLMPLAAILVCLVWITTFEISRYVSVASIVAALSLPMSVGAMYIFGQHTTAVLFYFSLFLTVIVIFRHRSNVSRLFRGTEPRFRRK